jgi:hypothetical protein
MKKKKSAPKTFREHELEKIRLANERWANKPAKAPIPAALKTNWNPHYSGPKRGVDKIYDY